MPIRDVDPSEIPELSPVGVEEVMGVGAGERALVMNLAANPQAMRAYLEKVGYQVRPYGEGFNFAVRRRDGDPWRVVDPRGLDPWDVTDIIGDALGGLLTTAGTLAGGGVASIGTGIASGLAVEGARQGLGAAAGIPGNFDPAQIGVSGAIGGAFPAAGGALGAAGRGITKTIAGPVGKEVGNLLTGLGAVAAGTGTLGDAFTRGEVLSARAAIPTKKLPTVEGVAKRLHSVVRSLWGKGNAHISEFEAAEKLAKIAESQGVTVDIRAPLEALDNYVIKAGKDVAKTTERRTITETAARTTSERTSVVGKEISRAGETVDNLAEATTPFDRTVTSTEQSAIESGGGSTTVRDATTKRTTFSPEQKFATERAAELSISEPSLPKTIQSVLDRINTFLGDADRSKVSPLVATKIKRQLQKIAFSKGAYENEPIGDAFTRIITKAGHEIRSLTESSIGAAGYPQYAKFMEVGAARFGALKDMYEAVGRDPEQALKYVREVYGGNFQISALHDFERLMGFPSGNLTKSIKAARIGQVAFGPGRRGSAPLFPRFTAVGTIFGAGIAANALGIDSGPVTTLAGLALASPRSILALTRLGQKIGGQAAIRAATKSPAAAASLLKTVTQGIVTGASQGTGRVLLNQDSKPKKKAYFTGQ